MSDKPGNVQDLFAGRAPGPLQALIRDQRVLFLLVGGANTAFSTALYIALVLLLGPRAPAVVSLVIAWFVSLVLVFFVYRRLVFRVTGNLLLDLARFASVNFLSLLLNSIALVVLTEYANLPPIPCQILITVVVVVFNYFGHKHFSFRR
ncbi:putative flippase GtrA [Lysobacter sp. OAE881]|uniref:GtrA family protein n=1 Tax=Lysobacter sp. OAE881 TaxID=2663813 RepID=UPI00178A8B26